jgi:hypothetical protein
MLTRYSRLIWNVLGSLLILIASGDDFSLTRIALPSLCSGSPTDTLPLDDPNTDFTKADNSPSSPHVGTCRFNEVNACRCEQGVKFAGDPDPSRFSTSCPPSEERHFCDVVARLRC